MFSRAGRFELPVGRGRLEAALTGPRRPRRAAVVLHGGGSTLNDGIVRAITRVFEEQDTAVLRFNFRGVGRSTGTFYADRGEGERADTRAALDFLADRHPDLPLWLAGVSFGAWVGLEVALSDRRVERLLGVALPLRIEQFDLSFLRRRRGRPSKALAVIQGADDEYGPRTEIEAFVSTLPEPKHLWLVPGAPHAFSAKRDALRAALRKAVRWLRTAA
jgi:uncharacterized protein